MSEPGIHYHVNEALTNHPDYIVFPDIPVLRAAFRHTWVLRRNFRPFVPQPDGAPMPDRAKTVEERSRLFSIYLRPWVLAQDHASRHVPHISELDVFVPQKIELEPKRLRIHEKQCSDKRCQKQSSCSRKGKVSSAKNGGLATVAEPPLST